MILAWDTIVSGFEWKKNGILKFCAFCILCSKKKNLGGCVSYIREQIRKVVDYRHGYDPWIRNAPLIQNLPTVFRSTQDTICILSPSSCSIIILLFKYIYNRSINSEYLGIMPYFVPIVSRIMYNILSHQQKYLKYLRAQKKMHAKPYIYYLLSLKYYSPWTVNLNILAESWPKTVWIINKYKSNLLAVWNEENFLWIQWKLKFRRSTQCIK